MTLIASFAFRGQPVLLGDLSLSADIENKGARFLSGPVDDIVCRSGLKLVDTAQKIVCVSDDLAIAWTGGLSGAEHLVDVLQRACPHGPGAYQALNEKLPGFDRKKLSDCSMIAIVRDHDVWRQVSMGQAPFKFSVDGLDNVVVAGSGMMFAVEQLRLSGVGRRPEQVMAGHVALQRASELLAWEMHNADGLRAGFGGGFEVCAPDSSDGALRLRKLDRVMHVFGVVDLTDGQAPRVEIEQVIRTEYYDDYLVYLRARLLNASEQPLLWTAVSARPIFKPRMPQERLVDLATGAALDSPLTITTWLFRRENVFFGQFSTCEFAVDAPRAMAVRGVFGQEVGLTIASDYWETLVSAARERLRTSDAHT